MNKQHTVSVYHIYIYSFFSCVEFPFVAFLYTHAHTMIFVTFGMVLIENALKLEQQWMPIQMQLLFTSCRHRSAISVCLVLLYFPLRPFMNEFSVHALELRRATAWFFVCLWKLVLLVLLSFYMWVSWMAGMLW